MPMMEEWTDETLFLKHNTSEKDASGICIAKKVREIGPPENYINLIHKVLNTFRKSYNWEYQDAFQEGYIGLHSAYKNFNLNLGFEFSTYAYHCIKGSILTYFNKLKIENNKLTCSLYYTKHTDYEGYEKQISYEPVIIENGYCNVEKDIIINNLFDEFLKSKHSKSKYRVLLMRYGLKGYSRMTLEQIAKIIRTSREVVRRLEERALSSLRKIQRFKKIGLTECYIDYLEQ